MPFIGIFQAGGKNGNKIRQWYNQRQENLFSTIAYIHSSAYPGEKGIHKPTTPSRLTQQIHMRLRPRPPDQRAVPEPAGERREELDF